MRLIFVNHNQPMVNFHQFCILKLNTRKT